MSCWCEEKVTGDTEGTVWNIEHSEKQQKRFDIDAVWCMSNDIKMAHRCTLQSSFTNLGSFVGDALCHK